MAQSIRCVKNISDIEYEEYTDMRDGQIYKTVTIGEQKWFAENLRYEYNEGSAKTVCHTDEDCSATGFYYTWAAAMDSAGIFGTSGKECGDGNESPCSKTKPVQGICPEGWHLPSKDDYIKLFKKTIYGNYIDNGYCIIPSHDAFIMLFAENSTDNEYSDARNDYGLSIKPRDFLWTSDEATGRGDNKLNGVYILFSDNRFDQQTSVKKGSTLSVRCMQDLN